ncbi:hypothetical protein GCM10025868_36030 [Angustibacter aerolatus]|uniref:ANTAR domain-containing protein n=1 Tax=Angustibacter aerolatus TaxID=1162965 RepID=A0ABQ6JLT2_9ACTN|nr:hypothetical protein GCM10025868_36030 [Angustibacter aerolatus]
MSFTAKPSRRNSGFQASVTASPAGAVARSMSCRRAAVPTGTVDLPTTSVADDRCLARLAERAVDVGQVGGVLALALRGAHADEVHVAVGQARSSRC